MVERKIHALKDLTLNTSVEECRLSVDEVRWVKFKSDEQVRTLVAFGQFELADDDAALRKPISVIYPPRSYPVPAIKEGIPVILPSPSPLSTPIGTVLPLEDGVQELLARMRERCQTVG